MKPRARFATALLTAATVLLVASGCSAGGSTGSTPTSSPTSSTAATTERSIEHELGATDIAGTPERVVALEFSFVDTLLVLGVDPIGIADDDDSSRVSQLAGEDLDYTSVGTRSEPNQEIIASLAPDLIIADLDRHSAVYEQLSAIAPTIVLNSREGGYEDIRDGVLTIADALGDEAEGEEVLARHDATMTDYAAQIPADETRTFQLAVARNDSLRLHTSGSFDGAVLAALGLTVAVQSAEPYEDVNLERIAAVDPGVLLIATDASDPITAQWADNPVWTGMTSISEGSSFDVDRNVFTRFRGIRSAELVAQNILSDVYGIGV